MKSKFIAMLTFNKIKIVLHFIKSNTNISHVFYFVHENDDTSTKKEMKKKICLDTSS